MNATKGRPRDASVDTKVIEATFDTIHETGLVGLSVDGIAARAGVSKAAIYRRWRSKEELIVDAIASVVDAAHVPHSGDTRTDLVTAVTHLSTFMCDSRAGVVLPWLAGEIAGQTTLGEWYTAVVMAPKRAAIVVIIERGVEQGELRPDLDVGTAVDMVIGPLLAKRLGGHLRDAPPSWIEELVEALLRGWAT
ncbi:MAG: TetR/AcrR family transcriptional regulator [Acidimicrobiia bacterium]|nr:TetR/AcrR family transcriptional regulator [Acidimicrobiia bacterium]